MSPPQHMQALADANRIRLAMAVHRRHIRALEGREGLRLAADLLDDPDEIVARMTLAYLLLSVPRVGPARMRKLLQRVGLVPASAIRRVGPFEAEPALSTRQRLTVAAELRFMANGGVRE